MADVTIYTKPWCPYCTRAKSLLDRKGVDYEEVDVSGDADREREMIDRAGGRRTVPQIFIDDRHVGGSDELIDLDDEGGLDPLLER